MKMVECESVDKQRSHEYHVARDVIITSMYSRLSDYVTRHNLMSQFLAEDAQGKY
jgi:hypothetical protein